ncbi:MAG: response regulator [Deltaproteobacteria bacterium]|nr:response regulator [Deltaproteobacteria bacterium]
MMMHHHANAATGNHLHILLADDDDDLRTLIRDCLEQEGWVVHEASSGLDLLDLLTSSQHFDLVVSDMRMPWLSGLQVATAVRRNGSPIPFVIMSAFGSREVRESVAALPASVFIQKPFAPEQLCALVVATLDQSQGK